MLLECVTSSFLIVILLIFVMKGSYTHLNQKIRLSQHYLNISACDRQLGKCIKDAGAWRFHPSELEPLSSRAWELAQPDLTCLSGSSLSS